ncbi:ABC transporter substrate-binding protein [Anoxynatronum buryatiense]|uniref:ABC-type Fe3+ transport system, substrate-binding protein n=1 Tax=Anoxynatronum buryatiense TaxID=489973 RepID=A0AA45WZ40_9CLOT|nr:ABC transporter substrate-binding protein [Anoxynatronum buryatiense]SMP71159.1 ABC-type Fe3+ transport system, substrate-binding protein [Anoxynatronum buryatiense]
MNNQPVNKDIKVYWNNPACLNKAVKERLDAKESEWKVNSRGTVLFDYYGLIEEMLMDERLERDLNEGGIGADIVVSTDMQLFHRKDMLLGNLHLFESIKDWFPIRSEFAEMSHPQGYFQPSLLVPVVIIKNDEMLKETGEILGWEDLLDPALAGKVAIASTDKPAGKSVLKGFWYLYGEEGLMKARHNFSVLSNPAAIFDAVDRGEYPLGIVPLLFATGAGKSGHVSQIWPKEGLMVIISYVAVRTGAGLEAKELLMESLYSEELQHLYSQRGFMIPVHDRVEPKQELKEQKTRFIYPDWEWVEKNDMNVLE